ncbi:hypothetical protein UNDKW_4913 [Undibacterium sp. KW1]|nr:hypothetical protein UNDKW_4913 [Undibacterium sp. KW1]
MFTTANNLVFQNAKSLVNTPGFLLQITARRFNCKQRLIQYFARAQHRANSHEEAPAKMLAAVALPQGEAGQAE